MLEQYTVEELKMLLKCAAINFSICAKMMNAEQFKKYTKEYEEYKEEVNAELAKRAA